MNLARLSFDRVLLVHAGIHAIFGVLAALWTAQASAVVHGFHPGLKPMRFGFSIAVYLATMGIILPLVQVPTAARATLAWGLSVAMDIEMALIVIQAVRGTSSHFNTASAIDRTIWGIMVLAIVVATLLMVWIALSATLEPLVDTGRVPIPGLLSFAIRVSLWMFLIVAWTGFSMGGRGAHSVGGVDMDAGLAMTQWSRTHGDLRVPHFLALHSLKVLPLFAWVLLAITDSERLQALAFGAVAFTWTALTLGELFRALSGHPSLFAS